MEKGQKAALIADIRTRFERMSSAVFIDFTGMTVADVTKLRDTFRKQGIEYKVVKNTLVHQALNDKPWAKKLDDVLVGMTGIAWSFEEPSAAARVLKTFVKENEKLKIKAGLLEGTVLNPKAVEEQLATLPNKDEARAALLATFMAPAQTFVRLLNAPAQQFAGVLAAKQRKDEGG
jgi:large subunit ribosomal protein L10